MSFGRLESVDTTKDRNPRLHTVRVRFEIEKEYWWTDVKYTFEEVDIMDSPTISHRLFMPLLLAFGVTITSLQGLEFNRLILDLQHVGKWMRHALYMAVTRVRGYKGIKCINIPNADDDFNENCPEMKELLLKFEHFSLEQIASEKSHKEAILSLDIAYIMESFKVFFSNIFI